jgi:putative urate catabolism protein
MTASDYPRDLIGYGANPPHARWPGGARIALQFVLNYEEGGENCVLHGDQASETFLSEIIGAQAFEARHLSMESMYEYGARAGAWRLLREFERRGLPLTVFGVSMALERNPELVQAFAAAGHEIACHSWRWIHYQHMEEAEERRHIEIGTRIIRELTGGARLTVSFVLNVEEGGESNVLHGDPASETFLSEIIGAAAFPDRHLSMESLYEYGSRAGVWRVLRAFRERGMPLTIFGVAMALERHPAVVVAFLADGHEIASHGYRWISYQQVPEAVERAHIARATEILTRLTGSPPQGWYTGRDSPNTRRLVVEHGGFVYDADSYADDLPYWTDVETRDGTKPQLVVPYTLDTNDMRFATAQGFHTGEQFLTYCRDAFDVLHAEGEHAPKMLSIGLHCRIVGRPARTAALARFLDYVQQHEDVWVARRIDIARHWIAAHPVDPPRA